MYMPPRAKIDSWSTDNCCVKWSLKCGTVFIGLLSLAWCGLTAAWFYYLTVKCWEVDIRNCTMVPEPERKIATVSAGEDSGFDVDILLCILAIYFSFYFLLSLLVIIGVLTKKPQLMQGWVHFTLILMGLLFTDLVVTLAFTTIWHLTASVSLFIASLYVWAVVRSHMNALREERKRIPLPENAIKEYTVDGMDITTLPIEDHVAR
ncbi:UNVERIFIED_CONTAM: hypothetical protein RMT77_012815 [Armadillidium vulgare]